MPARRTLNKWGKKYSWVAGKKAKNAVFPQKGIKVFDTV